MECFKNNICTIMLHGWMAFNIFQTCWLTCSHAVYKIGVKSQHWVAILFLFK